MQKTRKLSLYSTDYGDRQKLLAIDRTKLAITTLGLAIGTCNIQIWRPPQSCGNRHSSLNQNSKKQKTAEIKEKKA